MSTTRRCVGCGEEFPATEKHFYYVRKEQGHFHSRCKECHKKKGDAWRAANSERSRKISRESGRRERLRNPDGVRQRELKNDLKKNYGISLEQYQTMLDAQGGVCGICGQPRGKRRRLSVDHNHKTGEVRGLLCDRCNPALERLETVLNWATRAEEYLRRFGGEQE